MDADTRLLRQLGLEVNLLDAGCCGLAGSFGFEEHKYELSMKIGERILFPALRAAAPDTLISCNLPPESGDGQNARCGATLMRTAHPPAILPWTEWPCNVNLEFTFMAAL